MNPSLILLIDDDRTLLELLTDHLEGAGYRVLAAAEGPEGLDLAARDRPDLVVLDVMMPGMDGWEVGRRLREGSAVPIIMLTAKGEEIDKLRGFRQGVDDYVTKPFSFAELVARIGAVLARTAPAAYAGRPLRLDDLQIDLEQRRVTVSERPVDLTPTEYQLLAILARHPGRTVPSEFLLLEVWGTEYAGEFGHVKHYIWSLRKKIESDPGDPQHLLTDRGFGYRLE